MTEDGPVPFSEHGTGEDRVRALALTLTEARNAGWVADQADVSRSSAVTYLERMVDSGELVAVERGQETRYRPDPATQYFKELRRLITGHTRDELTDELDAIAEDISERRDRYGVETPTELRRTLGDADLSADERRERRRAVEDWEYDRHQRDLIEQALAQYDRVERLLSGTGANVRHTALL